MDKNFSKLMHWKYLGFDDPGTWRPIFRYFSLMDSSSIFLWSKHIETFWVVLENIFKYIHEICHNIADEYDKDDGKNDR